MTPKTTLRSQPVKSGRKLRGTGDSEDPGKRPKKVNSEIRKQQNRIASRNYREKRKRKLQYLQQLLRDQGPTDAQKASQTLEPFHDMRKRSVSAEYLPQGPSQQVRARSLSAEYTTQGPPSTPPVYPSSSDFRILASRSENTIDPAVAATSTSFNSHPLTASQPFPTYEPAWNPAIYDPPPPVHVSAWDVPATWMPNVDYTPQLTSRTEEYQYTPPPTQQTFEQLPTPPQHPQELVPSPDLFLIGSYHHYKRQEGHSPGIPNVSVCSSSRYDRAQYSMAP